MSVNSLQYAEKTYIFYGVRDGLRNDGRRCFDYRTIELETGVISNINGSAMVKIGKTMVIAGVKAELAPPLPHSPNKGWIEVSIECSPHAGLEFESKGSEDLASKVSQLLMEICNNDTVIDLTKLCVIPGELVYVLFVDIMVIGYAGNYIDAASVATKAALFNTRLRTVTVKANDDDNTAPRIEMREDAGDLFSLNVTDLPILLTFSRIGSEYIIDATKEEEVCSKAKLLMTVSPVGVSLIKEISSPGSLHVESVIEIIQNGSELALTLHKQLNKVLEEIKITPKEKPCVVNKVLEEIKISKEQQCILNKILEEIKTPEEKLCILNQVSEENKITTKEQQCILNKILEESKTPE